MINISLGKRKSAGYVQKHPEAWQNKNFAKDFAEAKSRTDVKECSVIPSDSVVYFTFNGMNLPCGSYSIPISYNLPHDQFKKLCQDAYFSICEKAHITFENIKLKQEAA